MQHRYEGINYEINLSLIYFLHWLMFYFSCSVIFLRGFIEKTFNLLFIFKYFTEKTFKTICSDKLHCFIFWRSRELKLSSFCIIWFYEVGGGSSVLVSIVSFNQSKKLFWQKTTFVSVISVNLSYEASIQHYQNAF